MAYDEKFMEAYEEFLLEPPVRSFHDWCLSIAKLNPAFDNVVDLGCGTTEFLKFAKPSTYAGIDEHPNKPYVMRGDYRKMKLTFPAATAFVSLFSIELTGKIDENYALYKQLFEQNLSMQAGLVGGLYYWDKKLSNPIEETGGIVSFQTLENLEDVRCDIFTEKRLIGWVPSKFFGREVIEIWKIFERSK